MAIVYDKLMALKIPEVERTYTQRDPIFYALSLGLGQDPVNTDELPFVLRGSRRRCCRPSRWWSRSPASGRATSTPASTGSRSCMASTTGVAQAAARLRHGHEHDAACSTSIDKGPGKGALIYSQRKVHDKASGELLATITQTSFCRGDGGFGGPPKQAPEPHPLPERAPDVVCDLPTRPEMALLYRWNADMNPLHADPAIARRLRASRGRSCTGSAPSALRVTRS